MSRTHRSIRQRLGALAVAAGTVGAGAAVVTAVAPAAHAAACTIHWVNSAGGYWFTLNNWDLNRLPTAGDTACIDAAGTYTVDDYSAVLGVNVVVGGATGTQGLNLQTNGGGNAYLDAVDVLPSGALYLHSFVNLDRVTVLHLTNDGGAVYAGATSGGYITSGDVTLNGGTFSESGTGTIVPFHISNLTVNPGTTATFTGFGEVDGLMTLAGGSLDVSTADLQAWGSIKVTGPVAMIGTIDSHAHDIDLGTASNAYIDVRTGYTGDGIVHLKGNNGAGGILSFLGGCVSGTAYPVEIDAVGSWTNAGEVDFGDDGCGTTATLVEPPLKTFTNLAGGTVTTRFGGVAAISGKFTNAGTLNVGYGHLLLNTGATLTLNTTSTLTQSADPSAPGVVENQSANSVSLGGVLAPQGAGLLTTPGQSVQLITGKVKNTFAKYTDIVLDAPSKGIYARPGISASTGVKLTRVTAKVTTSAPTVVHGTTVTVNTNNFIVGENIKLKFVDHLGASTVLGTFVAGPSGVISQVVAIPATAALGSGKIYAYGSKSLIGPKATITVS